MTRRARQHIGGGNAGAIGEVCVKLCVGNAPDAVCSEILTHTILLNQFCLPDERDAEVLVGTGRDAAATRRAV